MFVDFSQPWDRIVLSKEDEEIHQLLFSGKENQEDVSVIDEDCAVQGWLFGYGDWSVGGFLKDLGIPDVVGGMRASPQVLSSLVPFSTSLE